MPEQGVSCLSAGTASADVGKVNRKVDNRYLNMQTFFCVELILLHISHSPVEKRGRKLF